MNIKFLSAKRVSENSVEATYQLDETEFTVEWNNIHPETGELDGYDLQLNTASLNQDLADRVDESIIVGETDSNPDLELYHFVRDTFDRADCLDLPPMSKKVTKILGKTGCQDHNMIWFGVDDGFEWGVSEEFELETLHCDGQCLQANAGDDAEHNEIIDQIKTMVEKAGGVDKIEWI